MMFLPRFVQPPTQKTALWFCALLVSNRLGEGFYVRGSTSQGNRWQVTGRSSSGRPMASDSRKDPLDELGLPTPLILGSGSFTRKLILQEMGVGFQVIKREIDEKSIGDREANPEDLVLTLGKAKADHLVKEILAGKCQDDMPKRSDGAKTDWIVLTGDQVVVCDGAIMEKPESVEEAKQFVAKYPQHPPSTVGSCVLTHLPSGIQVSGTDTATIHFSPSMNAPKLVDDLLEEGAPILSCAGGLMVEHKLVKENLLSIDGTEDSVMGLSKDLVLCLLREIALKVVA